MSLIFLKILNMSISAIWPVLAIVLIRQVLKKTPKWINVLLWGIVAVRLVLPFSVQSAMSLIPSAETIPSGLLTESSFDVNTGITPVDDRVNDYLADRYFEGVTVPHDTGFDVATVCTVVWMLGVVILLIYTAVSYWSLRRKVATAIPYCEGIYQSENVNSPFVLGIIKPKIYLSFDMSEQGMNHVIAHERAHIRRKDHWWKPIGFMLLTVHWFNPLMWLAYVLLCRDIELACDEKVIRELNNEQRADYTQALLACSINRRRIAACPLAFGEVGVKVRVRSVMNYKKPAFWLIAVAIIACIIIAICFLTNPPDSKSDYVSPQNEQLIAFSVNLAENYSLRQEMILTDATPYWAITVNNQGDEAVVVELEGELYRVAGGKSEIISSNKKRTPGTYSVSFSGADASRMYGTAVCVLLSNPIGTEHDSPVNSTGGDDESEGIWTNGVSFTALAPSEEAVRSKKIEIDKDNTTFVYHITYAPAGLTLTFGLRAADGTEYSRELVGGSAVGVIENIPAGKYDVFVRNSDAYSEFPTYANQPELYNATGAINFLLMEASTQGDDVLPDASASELTTGDAEKTPNDQISSAPPSEVYGITLPGDGETIEYDPPFNIYTDEDGHKIDAYSASRSGKTITFYTSETEYYFGALAMQIVTADGELFVSLNGFRGNDGAYEYVISKYTNKKNYEFYLKMIKDGLGENYNAELDYYLVSFGMVYETNKE